MAVLPALTSASIASFASCLASALKYSKPSMVFLAVVAWSTSACLASALAFKSALVAVAFSTIASNSITLSFLIVCIASGVMALSMAVFPAASASSIASLAACFSFLLKVLSVSMASLAV